LRTVSYFSPASWAAAFNGIHWAGGGSNLAAGDRAIGQRAADVVATEAREGD